MRKILLSLFVMVLSLTTLVGCGNNEVADAEEDVELTYWYWPDNPGFTETMQEIVQEFNETNESGITVKAEEVPWDGGGYSETLFTAAMGGGGPDIAALKLTSLPLFANNELLADLSNHVDSWGDKDDVNETVMDIVYEVSGDNKLYALPWNIQVLYVYYRPSLFELAGVEVPINYEEFLEVCQKLTMDTDGDGQTDVYGFGMRGSNGGHEPWGSFIGARGGSLEDLTTPEAVQGMQDFIDLYENGYVPPTAMADGFAEVIANFKAGRTAMTIHHTGSSPELEEALGDDVAAFPFPAGEGQWTSLGDNQNVVFASAEHQEAAFEFLAYLTTGEGQETWTKATGVVPVSERVQAMDYFQEDPFFKASIDGLDYAGIFPILDTTTEWITSWPNTVGQALSGDISAEEAMQILQTRLWED